VQIPILAKIPYWVEMLSVLFSDFQKLHRTNGSEDADNCFHHVEILSMQLAEPWKRQKFDTAAISVKYESLIKLSMANSHSLQLLENICIISGFLIKDNLYASWISITKASHPFQEGGSPCRFKKLGTDEEHNSARTNKPHFAAIRNVSTTRYTPVIKEDTISAKFVCKIQSNLSHLFSQSPSKRKHDFPLWLRLRPCKIHP
jgi:hypothetical protein